MKNPSLPPSGQLIFAQNGADAPLSSSLLSSCHLHKLFYTLSCRLRGKTTRQDAILGLLLTRAEGLPYSVIMTPSLAIPVRLAYLSTIVGDFQLPPLCTRSTGVPLPSASYVQ